MFEIRDEFSIPFTDVELNMFIRDIEKLENGDKKAIFLRFLAGRNLTTLDEILAYSSLTEAEARDSLKYFIAKHFVIFFEDKENNATYYALARQQISAQFFAPLLVVAVRRAYGQVASQIIEVFLAETSRSHSSIVTHPKLMHLENIEGVFTKLVATKLLVSEVNFFAATRVSVAKLISDARDASADASRKVGSARQSTSRFTSQSKINPAEASLLDRIIAMPNAGEDNSSLAARGAFCINFNWLKIHVFTEKIEELFTSIFRAECGQIAKIMIDKGLDHSLSNGIAGVTNAVPLKTICDAIFVTESKKKPRQVVTEYLDESYDVSEEVIEDDEETVSPQVLQRIHDLLMVMSRDSNSLISRAGGSGDNSSFTLNIDAALSLLGKKIVDGVLFSAYSDKARRIYRILEDVGFITEKELPQIAMMTPNDAREAIYALMKDGIVVCNEVSKTNDFIASRTFQFFGIDHGIKNIFLERAWKSYDNTRSRLEKIGDSYETEDDTYAAQIHTLEVALKRLSEIIIILGGK